MGLILVGTSPIVLECKPPEDCPALEKFPEKLVEPGMQKMIDDSGCCKIAKLVCKEELCPKPPEHCPAFHKLKKDKRPGACCASFECEVEKDKCIYELSWMPAATGGERPKTSNEKQLIGKTNGEKWSDGPCRQCVCEKVGTKVEPVCSKTQCPNLATHPDRNEYDLELRPIRNQCCPAIVRVACRHLGKLYKLGENWRPNSQDPCSVSECQKSDLQEGVVIRTKVKSCDTKCDLGWKLAKPSHGECCGKCQQSSCIVDGKTKEVGEEWASPDFCTKYKCVNLKGVIQVRSLKC